MNGLKSPLLAIQNRKFLWGSRTYLMGILNITPDSFSGDGLLEDSSDPEKYPQQLPTKNQEQVLLAALEQARGYVEAGVDIIDIGGESTRPGGNPVSLSEELARVLPVIRLLADELDTLISIDTYKSQVAEAALRAGAHLINDVWGLKADPEIAQIAARHSAPVIMMHNRSSWANAEVKNRLGGRYVGVPYEDLLEDIKQELMESVAIAQQAGIRDDLIILDPGIGFGKTVEQNLELLDRVSEIRLLGYPILLGPSRKSFIGYTLDLPPEQRLEGTAAAIAIGIARGADIIRVHDVAFMKRVAEISDAITRRDQLQK